MSRSTSETGKSVFFMLTWGPILSMPALHALSLGDTLPRRVRDEHQDQDDEQWAKKRALMYTKPFIKLLSVLTIDSHMTPGIRVHLLDDMHSPFLDTKAMVVKLYLNSTYAFWKVTCMEWSQTCLWEQISIPILRTHLVHSVYPPTPQCSCRCTSWPCPHTCLHFGMANWHIRSRLQNTEVQDSEPCLNIQTVFKYRDFHYKDKTVVKL